MDKFHSKTKEEVIQELGTSEQGLSDEEAKKRLEKFGKNEIKKTHKFRPVKIILEQFKSFLIYILIAAIIISVLIGHFTDAIVIAAIVVVNASIGFFQQYKAEKAIIGLKKLLIPTSVVIRNGKHMEISSSKIVPGDVLVLKTGDKINADCRIIEQKSLQTNEAALTGESLSINKEDKVLPSKTILPERSNMVYTGTKVVAGSGKAIVVSTGMNTEFGKIASELQEIEIKKTPIQKRLDVFSKQLGLIILGLVVIVMLLGFTQHFDKVQMLLTAIALAVGSIPEGLPAVLAISFAISSVYMSKKNVIVRKLPAVESLGSVTVICSDKTGTLTEEKMHVQKIFVDDQMYRKKGKNLLFENKKLKKVDLKKTPHLYQTIKTSILCNNARYEKLESGDYSFIGDPTEQAFVRMALDFEMNKKELTEQEPRLREFEFDSKRKMMSLVRDAGRKKVLYSKGASEKILSKCSFEMVKGDIKKLTPKRKKELLEKSSKMEKEALRVLAFAYKNFNKKEKAVEEGMIFLGFIGMIDPPRKEVANAIKDTRNAGIKVKMITGDSKLTAEAIAKQIGLKGEIMTGSELEEVSESDLNKVIEKVVIFARTSPQQKLKITNALQSNNETVAITGDGVNDVLALKAADIGIAMGKRGTDVARDTADVVLIDDNFASIVSGIREGRKTYDNIKKFIKYMLAVNFSQIVLIMSALFLNLPLPLLPLQILWLNLLTDSIPALSLVFEEPEDVLNSKPRQEKSALTGTWKFILAGGIIAFAAEFIVYLIGEGAMPIETVRSMVLTTAILFELFFVYTCRSKKPLLEIGIFSNKWLNYAIILSLALQLILIYTPLAGIFKLAPLTLMNWMIILPFAVSGVILFEIGKYIKYRK
ncbi:HAD-IC family P-type ATPase [Candidatus Woesearchaeota archaeon]|nr:HAD-IC family P-type ATPase [Candidatus Woesearchaeota archaeon]